ncbi:hypothetical protein [Streptomyces sp. CB02923]|uniref:hypothetical protein n=1 Tax=Streptomyces sp. CB02923 TaxID=1718985 RepID=UPI0019012BC4|nr:hypothetical protein [Streptomyces sp. CB02923]
MTRPGEVTRPGEAPRPGEVPRAPSPSGRSGWAGRSRPWRPRYLLPAAAPAAGLALLLCGCGAPGEARAAGPAAAASAPVRVWPDRPAPGRSTGEPAPVPPDRVPGMPEVPGGDIRAFSALAVVQAEVAAHPGAVTGVDGMYEDTARRIAACTRIGAPGCPLREPRFHDLTGNGKDEMIIGFEDGPGDGGPGDGGHGNAASGNGRPGNDGDGNGSAAGNGSPAGSGDGARADTPDEALLGLRAYTLDHGVLVRILSTHVRPLSVGVAGREVIVREPAGLPGYENRSVYAWDAGLRAMTPHREEIRRARP